MKTLQSVLPAVEVYVRRVYRAHRFEDVSVTEGNGRISCSWTFSFADTVIANAVKRRGMLSVIQSYDSLKEELPSILDEFGAKIGEAKASEHGPINVLHIASTQSGASAESIQSVIIGEERKLNMLAIRQVYALVPVPEKDPEYLHFLSVLRLHREST
jgi:hypothetical protein